ncbi:MAG TPA: 2-amino-4-ketopentanoate thiolase [Tissierellia bacterium]|nr:2-amino-4-ketopentanoate thiolase [Tissierellia bacterium]
MIKKDTWVRIHGIVLEPSERSANVPEDTAKVPLEFWTKGWLLNDAEIGDEVTIRTACGREETGNLLEANPMYELNYGKLVPELIEIGPKLRRILEEENE